MANLSMAARRLLNKYRGNIRGLFGNLTRVCVERALADVR